MAKYVCQVCGYTVEGERPAKCPQCGADGSKFDEVQGGARVWADEHRICLLYTSSHGERGF